MATRAISLEDAIGQVTQICAFGYKGQVFETMDGTRVFIKSVDRSKHFLRCRQAWGIDLEIVDALVTLKVREIYLVVKGEGITSTGLKHFIDKSTVGEYPGFEEQYFLTEAEWA